MKLWKDIRKWYHGHDSPDDKKAKKTTRLCGGLILGLVLVFVAANTLKSCSNDCEEDKNTYLGEETCFAGEIYFKAIGISALLNENDSITLNLEMAAEQRHSDAYLNRVKIQPNLFRLKCIDLDAKNPMSVFFLSLVKATLSTATGALIDGSINTIDCVVEFATTYLEDGIENATKNADGFLPLDSISSFEPIELWKMDKAVTFDLSFNLTKEDMETTKIIALSIDDAFHFERHILLVKRPI